MEKETPKTTESKTRFDQLLKLCNDHENPNEEYREELHDLIHSNQDFRKRMQLHEGWYPMVLRARIEKLNFSDTLKEVLYVKCAQLREELGYATSNKLEKLAIEQIVLCWVNHHHTDLGHADNLTKPHSKDIGLYWEKRLAYSSRRYERALELLSKMRKMKLVVQVNNATNQIVSN
ncbi:hypothetical protein [Adhaeribacter pallidiroseus]|uniref:Uncharacterized protein n=1 Tax=Adhaeribacter pallidiroseus TaxID=2072847 RepID=A0A369QR12_9BACT|nr:hypothetical protein [Adhaeribacter pallidiroseus]RDC64618.1 hypothetical protein AHMF7616_03234 [Adhaeribacter pallidiroseus]